MPGAARTTTNAVTVEVIICKLRPIRNDTVRKIDRRLCELGVYEKLNLNSLFIGLLCWQRHKVIKDMQKGLPSASIEHWSWMPGGGRAGIAAHVIWKVPTLVEDRDLQKTIDLQNQCVSKQKIYYNRATRIAFLAVAQPLYMSSKSALMASVKYFTGEYSVAISTPSDRSIENQRPQIAAELALLTQDEDIALDLRILNGRPNNPAFDSFWAKGKFLLEEYRKVDDRRHGAFTFACFCLMPFVCIMWVV